MPREEGSCFFAVLLFPSNYLAATDRIPIARKPVDRFCGMLLSVSSVGAKTRAAAWLACVMASIKYVGKILEFLTPSPIVLDADLHYKILATSHASYSLL